MSLLITSNTAENDYATEVAGINRPYSYTNHLSDTTKIPANSKVAVESLKINKAGNMTINRGTQFGIYFGEEILDPNNNYNVLSLTAPTFILEENEQSFTGNINDIADKIQVAGKRALWHPNLCKNASTVVNPGFTCEPKRNSSTLDFLGFKLGITNTDSSKNSSHVSASWVAVDDIDIEPSLGSNLLENDTGDDRAFIGIDYPLSLAGGEFSCSLVEDPDTFTEIGLVRYQHLDGAYGDNERGLDSPPWTNLDGEEFYDWLVTIRDNGSIEVAHTIPSTTGPERLQLKKINYGASLNASANNIDRITFKAEGERMIITAYNSASNASTVLVNGSSATSASNAKPISQTTRWLYPKIYLLEDKSIEIRKFDGVDVQDLVYFGSTIDHPDWSPDISENQIGLDWWKYVISMDTNYFNSQVGYLVDLSKQIDLGGFSKITNRVDQVGLNASNQIDYKPTLIFAPADRYLLTNSLNSQYLFGFVGRSLVNVPTSTGAASPFTLTFESDSVPELKSTNSLFVRLRNFTHDTINFSKSSKSKIIYHIPAFSNNGESTGALFFAPPQRVYVDLNNPTDLFISDISVDIVHDDETMATELQGKTTIVLHIIQ